MKNFEYMIICSVLLTSTLGLASNAYAEGLVLSAETNFLEYRYNQIPAISGIVTDLDGNPLSRVQVFASFPYVKTGVTADTDGNSSYSTTIIGFTTFNDGKFLLNPTNPSPAGEHTIKVTAKKDTLEESVFVTYKVKENPRIAKSVNDSMVAVEPSRFSIDPLDQQMETQKKQVEENQNVIIKKNKSQQVIEQQRQVAEQDLQNDLIGFEKKYEANSPRNAFASFIEKIDLSLRALFWDQFEFTQNIHDQAYQAKVEALKQGQTSQQATKVFQDTAAVSHEELVEYNEMLNVKHGFANQTIQDKFDKKGKLPRTED